MKQNLITGLLEKQRPATFLDLKNGKGTKHYNHNIQEVGIVEDEFGTIRIAEVGETPTGIGYSYDCLRVEKPVTANSIFGMLLNIKWPPNFESKLINEYQSANEGILDESYKAQYLHFLNDRIVLKQMVDTDCNNNSIPQN